MVRDTVLYGYEFDSDGVATKFYDKDKYYLKILCIMKPVVSDNIF